MEKYPEVKKVFHSDMKVMQHVEHAANMPHSSHIKLVPHVKKMY